MKFLVLNFLIILMNVNGQTDVITVVPVVTKSSTTTTQLNFNTTTDLYGNLYSKLDRDDCKCVKLSMCKTKNLSPYYAIDPIVPIEPDCNHYLLTCCKKENLIPPSTDVPPKVNPSRGCGNHHPEGVGFELTGDLYTKTQFGEFPWMVAILREDGIEESSEVSLVYKCGGSLIHPQMVLTAAHCVDESTKKFRIRAGEWDTQTENEPLPYQDRLVKSILIHPEYNKKVLFNDIALLVLDFPLDIADNVEPVCLPRQDEFLNSSANCFTTGWGKHNFGIAGKYQAILNKAESSIVQRDDCQEKLRRTRLGEKFILHKSFICVDGETCINDSGSPLVCPIPGHLNKFYQRGFLAWGLGCHSQEVPNAYGDVAGFRNWIDDNMKKLNFETSSYTI